ncbi:glycosyltransferase family 4 protein [Pseudarthrobacter phenanthrenivorans]|uniref:glycosyltransferase family 4 protein n=1 Tax=Pseudarthrobacter phenanthrenivorans TaxID=361575 RepID=UPI002F34FFD5
MEKHLFLAHSAAPSGAELALLRLARQLPAAKTVVMFAEDGPLIDRYRLAGVEVLVREVTAENVGRGERSVLRAAGAIVSYIRYGWQLGSYVKGNEISLVVANSVKSLVYGAVAAARARVPIVWSVHDRISDDYFRRSHALLIRLLGRFVASAYIVNSRATLETIWPGGKPVLISPPGIDVGSPVELVERQESVEQVVMVGRLSPWKGQHHFIEAFDRAFSGTSVKAVIVGDALFGEADYANALRDKVKLGQSSDQISFTGAITDVRSVLLESQILVHASTIPEPFGSVVVEGLDAGCAVIATCPGGPSEVISHGHDGLLIPCDDAVSLESALIKLDEDPELRKKLARNGPIRSRDFDVKRLAESMSLWLDGVQARSPLPKVTSGIPPKTG